MKLEIITPEKLVFSADVAMATLPGACGEFGVMENHAPTIAELKSGEIAVYDKAEGGTPKARFQLVSGGFAQVSAKGCTILSDDSINTLEAENAFQANNKK